MIKLHDDAGNEYKFDITIFPDKSSQCWHISPEPEIHQDFKVTWMFENEGEIFHVHQLGYLLRHKYRVFPTLVVPYLPYGRQDKPIQNDATFARHSMIGIVMDAGYTRIVTYDAHSSHPYIESKPPTELIEAALPGHDVVCFPDRGALLRYEKLVAQTSPGIKFILANKIRNQQTGNIEGMSLETNGHDLTGVKILVVDDIIDAGGTFIAVAKEIQKYNPGQIDLAISHGLFTKGVEIIYDAGYKNIYTTNSLLRQEHLSGQGMSEKYMGYSGIRDNGFQVVKIC
jgi:ribose-phosphate pyrophosphokinase